MGRWTSSYVLSREFWESASHSAAFQALVLEISNIVFFLREMLSLEMDGLHEGDVGLNQSIRPLADPLGKRSFESFNFFPCYEKHCEENRQKRVLLLNPPRA